MKQKTCRFCKEKYTPSRPMQPCCDKFECKCSFVSYHIKKQREKKAKQDRQDLKLRKEAIKTIPQLKKEAQKWTNQSRRLEELQKGRGCISCGRTQEEVEREDGWKPGGAWDAGHFMSVGHMPSKRYLHANIWLQCKSCNAGSGKYARKAATVSKAYEENLVAIIGREAVEELKRDDGPAKFTREQLIEIIATEKARCKALMAERKKNGP